MEARRTASTPGVTEHPLSSPISKADPNPQRVTKYNAVPYIILWLKAFYQITPGSCITKAEVYKDYLKFCQKNNIETTSTGAFGKIVRLAFPEIKCTRKGPRGRTKHFYKNFGRQNPSWRRTPSEGYDSGEEASSTGEQDREGAVSPSVPNNPPTPPLLGEVATIQMNGPNMMQMPTPMLPFPTNVQTGKIIFPQRNDHVHVATSSCSPICRHCGASASPGSLLRDVTDGVARLHCSDPPSPSGTTSASSTPPSSPHFPAIHQLQRSERTSSPPIDSPSASRRKDESKEAYARRPGEPFIPPLSLFGLKSEQQPGVNSPRSVLGGVGSGSEENLLSLWPKCPEFSINVEGIPVHQIQLRTEARKFSMAYQLHFQTLFDATLRLQLVSIREIVMDFWSSARMFLPVLSIDSIMQQIPQIDYHVYRVLADALLPNPFCYGQSQPSSALMEFTDHFPGWLMNAAMHSIPAELADAKIRVANSFCTSLKIRATIHYFGTKLNDLLSGNIGDSHSVVPVSPSSSQFNAEDGSKESVTHRMLSDWMRLNMGGVYAQLEAYSRSSGNHVSLPATLVKDVATLLQNGANVYDWNEWVHSTLVSRVISLGGVGGGNGDAHQFVSKWSQFVSQVLCGLTPFQAATVSHFQLLFAWIEAVLYHYLEKQDAFQQASPRTQNGGMRISPWIHDTSSPRGTVLEMTAGDVHRHQCCMMESSPRDLELPSPRHED